MATVELSRSISHLGQRRTELDRDHQGVKGAPAMLMLTPALFEHYLSQACRSKLVLECLDVWMVQLNARPRQTGVSQTDDRCAVRSN